MLPRFAAALIILLLISALIPMLVNRYKFRSLWLELSRKVLDIARGAKPHERPSADDLGLLSEEFIRLDQQLTSAHLDLLARHQHEMESGAKASTSRSPCDHRSACVRAGARDRHTDGRNSDPS